MATDESDPSLVQISRRERIREAFKSARHSALGENVEEALKAATIKAAELLRDRTTVEAIQRALAGIGQIAATATFRVDPEARLMFEFANWAEDRHGRLTVVAATMQLAQRLVDALAKHGPSNVEGAVADLQDELRGWVRILVAGSPTDDLDLDDLPERFRPILDGQRHHLDQRTSTLSALILPAGVNDVAVAYMLVTVPRFLQTYLMRALVDALPDLVSQTDEWRQ